MTQKQMIDIIPTIQKLVGTNLPVKQAYAIFRLAKEIDEQKDFFITSEKKLIEKYNGTVDENGRITFENSNNFAPFAQEYEDLNNLEVEIKESLPIVIKLDEISGGKLTPTDFFNLDGIINFE